MINLQDYREYWERMVPRIPEITGVLPVTIDDQMGKKIQGLLSESVTIFVFPPIVQSAGKNVDDYREKNHCVIFLMAKYDPQRQSSFDVLIKTQPIIEKIKEVMLCDLSAGCPILRLDSASMEIAPETELYGRFAGWSIAFNAIS